MALSDKTKDTLNLIAETAAKGIDVTVDLVELLTPFVPEIAKVPVDMLEGLIKTIILTMPDFYAVAASKLGLDEHVTINVTEPDANVTGTIHH